MITHTFSSYSTCDKPFISSSQYGTTGTNSHRGKSYNTVQIFNVTINATTENSVGLWGDLQIHHPWQSQTDAVIDVIVTDTDKNIKFPDPWKMCWNHRIGRRKINNFALTVTSKELYPPHCIRWWGDMSGIKMLLKELSWQLATKWDFPCSQAHNYVNTHVSLAIIQANFYWLQKLWVLSNMESRSTFNSNME